MKFKDFMKDIDGGLKHVYLLCGQEKFYIDKAIEKISRAFGLLPKQKTEPEFVSASRRQPCKKNDMER